MRLTFYSDVSLFLNISFIVFALFAIVDWTEAGCASAKQCCESKNNTCRQDGARISNNESFTCFCDAACFQLRDCCTDYNATCLAVDCVLDEEWDEWTPCDVTCGLGIKQRQKRILQHPKNGGRDCETAGLVVEKAVCRQSQCDAQFPASERTFMSALDNVKYTESAKIISLGHNKRTKNDLQQSRWRRYAELINSERRLNASATGSRLFDTSTNHDHGPGHGQGHRFEPTYHALYELTELRDSCRIFKDDRWPHQLAIEMTVCVQCQPLAKKRKLDERCEGDGIYMIETKWISATMPGCRGKWRKLMENNIDGHCPTNNTNIFVFI